MDLSVGISSGRIENLRRDPLRLFVRDIFLQFFNDNDAFLVNCRDEIVGAVSQKHPDIVNRTLVLLCAALQDEHHPSGIRIDMQLLGAVVDINQQKIVQQQVLDEIILVKPFFISSQQTLQLECRQFAGQQAFFIPAPHDQNILELKFVVYLEKLIIPDCLGVCLRLRKTQEFCLADFKILQG